MRNVLILILVLVSFSTFHAKGKDELDVNERGVKSADKCNAQEDEKEVNSLKCNGTGTYECGACTCNEGRAGDHCECDLESMPYDDPEAMCKRTNGSQICESHGKCVCGQCACDAVSPHNPAVTYYGQYCGCEDVSCDYYHGKICGGASRGMCRCGRCVCEEGYTGPGCHCPTSQDACRASNGKICNGKGACMCGQCVCDKDLDYRGRTCEDCPTCPGRCLREKACVQCVAFGTGPLKKEACAKNCHLVEVVDRIRKPDSSLCRFRDEDDCIFYFAYRYNSARIQVQRTKEC